MTRHQYRDTADHDLLHGIEPEPEGQPYERCPKHGPWLWSFSNDECPDCYLRRQELADIEAAEWDQRLNHPHR